MYRPNLIDDINISKFLENDTSRYKCTSGDSRGWDSAGGGGGHHFFLKDISSFLIIFIRVHALDLTYSKCSCHVQPLEKIMPK